MFSSLHLALNLGEGGVAEVLVPCSCLSRGADAPEMLLVTQGWGSWWVWPPGSSVMQGPRWCPPHLPWHKSPVFRQMCWAQLYLCLHNPSLDGHVWVSTELEAGPNEVETCLDIVFPYQSILNLLLQLKIFLSFPTNIHLPLPLSLVGLLRQVTPLTCILLPWY